MPNRSWGDPEQNDVGVDVERRPLASEQRSKALIPALCLRVGLTEAIGKGETKERAWPEPV